MGCGDPASKGRNVHKITGCCSMCDKEVYEVVTRFPNREPRALGRELDVVKRNYILSGGNHISLTFCSDCKPEPKDLPALWRKVMKTFIYEQSDEFRAMIDQPPITDNHHDGWMKDLEKQIILGELHV